ncbi:hypothetical protein EC556_03705 [Helicobacter pylori]|nr:hypothetical protein EC556_03705 [Helicobacter pylori]
MGSFGVRVLFLIPTPFSLAKNHQTNSSFSVLAIHYCSLYKSGVMLDKVTKACYNSLAFFCFCSF